MITDQGLKKNSKKLVLKASTPKAKRIRKCYKCGSRGHEANDCKTSACKKHSKTPITADIFSSHITKKWIPKVKTDGPLEPILKWVPKKKPISIITCRAFNNDKSGILTVNAQDI